MTTLPIKLKRPIGSRAFTLVEVMIGATLGGFVLAGVLSTFLMLGRSGISVANYSMMESQVRRAMEEFAQDVRMSSDITWNSAESVTLTVPNNYISTSNQVTYAYDSATGTATSKCFYRMPGNAASANATTIFIRNVASASYSRFDRLDAPATTDASTKRVQLTLLVRDTGSTIVSTSNIVVSASYVLRNKIAN